MTEGADWTGGNWRDGIGGGKGRTFGREGEWKRDVAPRGQCMHLPALLV